jgi:hypothetical protein
MNKFTDKINKYEKILKGEKRWQKKKQK